MNEFELYINITRKINAPIEQVFDAWLNPELLARFMRPMPKMTAPETTLDATEGGRFIIKMVVGGHIIPHQGLYLKMDRPNILQFSWESPFSAENSVVTLKFKSLDANCTELDLDHVGFSDEDSCANHKGGWINILRLFSNVLNDN